MGKISSVAELKDAIELLELEHSVKGKLLKEQFFLTYESLKPVNLLKSALREVSSSPYLIDNILGTALGLTTGYLSKKLVVGASGNLFRKMIGSILQFGVTNIVAQHSDTIKSFGKYIFQYIFHKKEMSTE